MLVTFGFRKSLLTQVHSCSTTGIYTCRCTRRCVYVCVCARAVSLIYSLKDHIDSEHFNKLHSRGNKVIQTNTQHEPEHGDGSNAVLLSHSLYLAEQMSEENTFLKKHFLDAFMCRGV